MLLFGLCRPPTGTLDWSLEVAKDDLKPGTVSELTGLAWNGPPFMPTLRLLGAVLGTTRGRRKPLGFVLLPRWRNWDAPDFLTEGEDVPGAIGDGAAGVMRVWF